LRVKVLAFRLSGNTVFSESELLETVKDYVGKDLDLERMNEAATRIRRYYLQHGYFLAQAYIPQQEMRAGVLEIAVIEGRVGKLELVVPANLRVGEELLRGILGSYLQSGDLVTERNVEAPLLLIGDLPNVDVSSELRPGAVAGTADLKLNVVDVPGRVTGFVDFDNCSNRFVGEYRFGINLNLNNPAGRGDQLTFRGIANDESGNNVSRIAYVIPVGSRGTRIGASFTKLSYRLTKDFASLQSHGDAESTSIYGFHPFIRSRSTNLVMQAAFEDKKLEDRTDSLGLFEERKIRTFRLGAAGDFRDGVLGGGFNAYTVTLTAGDLEISPADVRADDQADLRGLKTLGDFGKTNFDFRRLQRVSDRASVVLAVAGQVASKNLAAAEKFSLGGPNGVRAYPVGEGIGDNAYVASGEFRYVLPEFRVLGGDVTLAGFYDVGWSKRNRNPLLTDTANIRHIGGYGVGATVGKEADFLVRASAAWRDGRDAPLSDTAKRSPRIWVQAIKWF
jgi:hemolysin activation/secretion protein